jgi:multidrug transporter EmrE-like cation transporter
MMVPHLTHAALATAAMIAAVVVTATAGDILTASAMRQVGDLDDIRAERGLVGAAGAVVSNGRFGLGVVCLALSFFSLLYAFSHRDLSLIGPAATSLTFVTNALAAKFFLHENVDRRRWMAAIFVCVGVALVAF